MTRSAWYAISSIDLSKYSYPLSKVLLDISLLKISTSSSFILPSITISGLANPNMFSAASRDSSTMRKAIRLLRRRLCDNADSKYRKIAIYRKTFHILAAYKILYRGAQPCSRAEGGKTSAETPPISSVSPRAERGSERIRHLMWRL